MACWRAVPAAARAAGLLLTASASLRQQLWPTGPPAPALLRADLQGRAWRLAAPHH